MFGFQRLDVYRCSVDFLRHSVALADRVPAGHSPLSDQLRRASVSISLNIAEGSGKTGRDARRFYGIARASALECAAVLEVLPIVGGAKVEDLAEPLALLERVVEMLTRMSRG